MNISTDSCREVDEDARVEEADDEDEGPSKWLMRTQRSKRKMTMVLMTCLKGLAACSAPGLDLLFIEE